MGAKRAGSAVKAKEKAVREQRRKDALKSLKAAIHNCKHSPERVATITPEKWQDFLEELLEDL